MKRGQGSTLFLKAVIILIGMAVLTLAVFLLSAAISSGKAREYFPVLIVMCAAAIPFYAALYQSFKLLVLIDKSDAFSSSSVNGLKIIKYCAIAVSALYAAGLPFLVRVAHQDDAPGLTALGVVIVLASIVIATFVAVLQKLLRAALDIKSENDLTV